MDPIEQAANHALEPTPDFSSAPEPERGQPPTVDPLVQAKMDELETTRMNMEKGFTQKMQAAADERRAFADERAQFMAQQQHAIAAQSATNSPTRGLGEELAATNPHIAENPAAQALFDQVGNKFDARIASLQNDLAERDQQMAAMRGETDAIKNARLTEQYKREHAELVSEYGQETVDANAQGIYDLVAQAHKAGNPLHLESAFLQAAPGVVREHIAAQERVKMRDEFSTERAAGLQMDNILGKAPADTFKAGESFEETAMRHASPAVKAQMVREALEAE